MPIKTVIEQQRQFAILGKAKEIPFRIQQLQKLKKILKDNEADLCKALYADMKKSTFDVYLSELGMLYHELNYTIKHLEKWSQPKRVKTGLLNFPAKSFIYPEPYGTTFIIGVWNYPYQLTFMPLIAAMAAGNTSIIKPSELTVHASAIITKLINQHFAPEYLFAIEGDASVSQEILSYRFDKIFFTGGETVGKIVAKAAAEYLTPVCLELGGKSPCLVFSDSNLKVAAQRIIWGKFLNAGQTCIAPDYLLVEKVIYEPFLAELKSQLHKMLGSNPHSSEDYSRIVNQKHLQRLQKLIDPQKIVVGGDVIESENYFAPTILRDVTFQDEVMKDEIFGPILPVIPFTDLDWAIREIKARPSPLALYIFGKNKAVQSKILKEISFGGGCINDVLMHITNNSLPFGGVGNSGMGNYHGEAGFKAFSHYKSILQKSLRAEPPLKYPPYNKLKLKIARILLG